MSNIFDTAFEHTIGVEGGYSNNPSDPGGETMYGVTLRVAREHGYLGAMRDLPLEAARVIAKAGYWDSLNLDRVAAVAPSAAVELFDTAYNCGIRQAGKFLQRALNKFNRQQVDYADVTDDGEVGVFTLTALVAFVQKRGLRADVVLTRALNCQQGAYYFQIAEVNPKLEDFEFGWFNTRVGV